MRVNVEHEELKWGLIFKKTYQSVYVTAELTEEEKQIIEENDLEKRVIMERPPDARDDMEQPFTFSSLLIGDRYCVNTLAEAKEYEEVLLAAIKEAKDALMTYGAPAESKTVEF